MKGDKKNWPRKSTRHAVEGRELGRGSSEPSEQPPSAAGLPRQQRLHPGAGGHAPVHQVCPVAALQSVQLVQVVDLQAGKARVQAAFVSTGMAQPFLSRAGAAAGTAGEVGQSRRWGSLR